MKKGLMESTLAKIVLALAVIIVMFLIFKTPAEAALNYGDRYLMKKKLESCATEGFDLYGNPRPDTDGDGLPDFCDNCPTVNNELVNDKDMDLFPEGCETKRPDYDSVLANLWDKKKCKEKAREDDTDASKHPCYLWNT